MLGIIIGIGAVIVMISVGRGASAGIQQQINDLGANMLMVYSGSTQKGGVRGGYGSSPTLRVKDAEEACADAKRKGVQVGGIVEQKKIGPYHNFKELFFSEEEIPIKRLYLIAFYPPDKIHHDHRIYRMDEPEESN